MCEDCNTTIVKHDGYARVLIHACAKVATLCILQQAAFDSCMREDCNEGPGVGGVGGVLIHVCARIATGASAGLWSS